MSVKIKTELIDTKEFTECVLDLYYCLRCGADSNKTIDVLKSVYSDYYILQGVNVLRSFCTLMAVVKK